jgi:DNA-binding PadR family transcriptional regulator
VVKPAFEGRFFVARAGARRGAVAADEAGPGAPWRPPEPALLVLVGLAGGPRHGYALLREAASVGYRFRPHSLYGALARLERRGWIAALPPQGRRRPYRLTAAGRAALRELAEGGLTRLDAP